MDVVNFLHVAGTGPGVLRPLFPERLVGELRPVVGLEDLRLVAEEGDRQLERGDRLVHVVLLGEVEEPLPAGLVDHGVWEEGLRPD